MIKLANIENCTACGACEYVCRKQAIKVLPNKMGDLYPIINIGQCVSCHLCERVCPALHDVKFNMPLKAYAAWNSNQEKRKLSASGGIASAAYDYCIENDWKIAGASQNSDMSVSIRIGSDTEHVSSFKNSKYVFSRLFEAYADIKDQILEKNIVLIIALPCQIAAIKSVFKENENLLLADVVCHGVISNSILQQYLSFLRNKYGKEIKRMFFRDPHYGTQTFTFSLYDEDGNCFYSGRTREGELYNYAYHCQVAYRENCYHCKYAKSERVSDFTLSDYKGLGAFAPWHGEKKKVSSVLVNSLKGDTFIKQLINKGRIIAYERPVNEPIQGDPQLNHPSKKSKARLKYEKLLMMKHGDFVNTIISVRKYDMFIQQISFFLNLPVRVFRKFLKM